jgi:lysophospholipase L1-like esterase
MVSDRGFSLSSFANKLRAAVVGIALVGTATLASAGPPDDRKDGGYLSLGDSVVFGYITRDGPGYLNPANFLGYPAFVSMELKTGNTNAACPGETTTSFIAGTVPDNGCQFFRSRFPLHVAYSGGQLEFATSFLADKKNKTQLVTVTLGANDGFLLQQNCLGDPVCIQNGLPGLLATVGANMNYILGSLRATGFKGVLMVVNYYSLDYTDAAQTGLTTFLNQTLAASAAANDAVVADAFAAFQTAANSLPAPFTGKTCLTGLLNGNPTDPSQSTCDVHPSLTGQQLLADVVEDTFRAGKRH